MKEEEREMRDGSEWWKRGEERAAVAKPERR
jgi:hypothetical protein